MNILIIGDSTVGKSSILTRYTEDYFTVSNIKTIGKFIILIYT